ncbi:thymidylate synthase, flavin-dependent [Caldicellulosiruptor kronotskyensis 2002]|uniref:Flavin-dependent thymidylate synthase n=1 Tax=Caldicellulosiruptor kronotskyensis (strain DSM 18902 / VKM B-2412 / 2002) TaxID=632348 RepID=E4SEM0_CALK2|nr:FAD-dependent thymidylate synthase [Caldicellulosiruptor kronotskyensis]ADQ45507.1 thymidylate synthase, flavin-dependent [Caldicellulosiruptor kronotskyensis 2002]
MKFKVVLLSHTPEPEKVVATAAKLCYSNTTIENIFERLDDETVKNFLNFLVEVGHQSPLEHVSFTFGIEGVSRSFTHQLVRHRIASYSQQSQRYVKMDGFDYVIPPSIEEDEELKNIFIDTMNQIAQAYAVLSEKLKRKHTEKFKIYGISEKEALKKAEKMAIEDARYVLPNACETKIIMTMNARELLHFFSERCCNRAQWEIRAVADKILELVKNVAPNIFKFAGPKCIKLGYCPEGKFSCGEFEKVREKYLGKMREEHENY